jgi:hypothetical protein
MPRSHLDDASAKEIFRSRWRLVTKVFCPLKKADAWVRVQPVMDGSPPCPKLSSAGQRLWRTQPDALYVRLGKGKLGYFVDCVAIEVCTSSINFFNKRSRYQPSLTATVLELGERWLRHIRSKIRRAGDHWQEYEISPGGHDGLPVRYMTVIYALDDDTFHAMRGDIIPRAHEFFMKHSSLETWTGPNIRRMFSWMAPEAHFYPAVRH